MSVISNRKQAERKFSSYTFSKHHPICFLLPRKLSAQDTKPIIHPGCKSNYFQALLDVKDNIFMLELALLGTFGRNQSAPSGWYVDSIQARRSTQNSLQKCIDELLRSLLRPMVSPPNRTNHPSIHLYLHPSVTAVCVHSWSSWLLLKTEENIISWKDMMKQPDCNLLPTLATSISSLWCAHV